jgi:DNA-binding transcriptional regulator YhcF (GntR family)
MEELNFSSRRNISVVAQIANFVRYEIQTGKRNRSEKLLSINQFSRRYNVARDSVEKAYNLLKSEDLIVSYTSRGYYVSSDLGERLRILLLFNKISQYKKIIYDAFVETLGDKATVDLSIHHYSVAVLEDIIDRNQGKYHHYVLMPHFAHEYKEEEFMRVIHKIPSYQLMLLDKQLPQLSNMRGVYQNFSEDIYLALHQSVDLIAKYQRAVVVFPEFNNHPVEILDGIQRFCQDHALNFTHVSRIEESIIAKSVFYIVLTESDLAQLIKMVRFKDYLLGEEIGVLSFNETIFKELLNITVMSTDFALMGHTAASMILNTQEQSINNPFKLIRRGSL